MYIPHIDRQYPNSHPSINSANQLCSYYNSKRLRAVCVHRNWILINFIQKNIEELATTQVIGSCHCPCFPLTKVASPTNTEKFHYLHFKQANYPFCLFFSHFKHCNKCVYLFVSLVYLKNPFSWGCSINVINFPTFYVSYCLSSLVYLFVVFLYFFFRC